MNHMNQMKHPVGWRGSFEILADFFYFVSAKGAFYVHFASCGSLIGLYERLEAVISGVNAYLMNYMKVYEVGRFKEIFGIGLFCYGDLMNMEKCLTSLIFIKSKNRPPLSYGHLPQIPLRGYFVKKEQGE